MRFLVAGDGDTPSLVVPIVFLTLPVTVMFAIYPGVRFIRFTM
ncbi:hypothetical protein GCM10027053_44730 [Intrasporangium mesophilum]